MDRETRMAAMKKRTQERTEEKNKDKNKDKGKGKDKKNTTGNEEVVQNNGKQDSISPPSEKVSHYKSWLPYPLTGL
jgi:hypothetical protein